MVSSFSIIFHLFLQWIVPQSRASWPEADTGAVTEDRVASVASVARPSDPRRDALLPLAPRALFLGAFHVQQPHAEGEEGAEGHEGRSGDTRGHQEGSHRRHLRLGGGMGVVFQNGKEW